MCQFLLKSSVSQGIACLIRICTVDELKCTILFIEQLGGIGSGQGRVGVHYLDDMFFLPGICNFCKSIKIFFEKRGQGTFIRTSMVNNFSSLDKEMEDVFLEH